MFHREPRVAGCYALDAVESRQLWNWILRRQGLADGSRLHSVVSIADASLGLHAARLPSPFSTLAARSANSSVPLSLFGQDAQRDVVTVRCMRKTLHTLPLALASAAHAATVHFRERDALRAIVNAGKTRQSIDSVADTITRILDASGPSHHRDIEADLVAAGTDRMTARLVLKLAWERGQVVYLNQTNGWNREVRKFGLTRQVYPTVLDFGIARDQATMTLITAYFDRYGPASLGDARWWSGLSRSAVVAALASADDLVQVTASWSQIPQYMFHRNFDHFRDVAGQTPPTGLNLLAHEDVALKAYYETRGRYLGLLPAQRVFNRIGEVLPAILHDGQVVGTWTWDPQRREARCGFARNVTSPAVRRETRVRTHRLTAALRQGMSLRRPVRNDDVPPQRCQTPDVG